MGTSAARVAKEALLISSGPMTRTMAAKIKDFGVDDRRGVTDAGGRCNAIRRGLGPELAMRSAASGVQHEEIIQRPAATHAAKDEQIATDERRRVP